MRTHTAGYCLTLLTLVAVLAVHSSAASISPDSFTTQTSGVSSSPQPDCEALTRGPLPAWPDSVESSKRLTDCGYSISGKGVPARGSGVRGRTRDGDAPRRSRIAGGGARRPGAYPRHARSCRTRGADAAREPADQRSAGRQGRDGGGGQPTGTLEHAARSIRRVARVSRAELPAVGVDRGPQGNDRDGGDRAPPRARRAGARPRRRGARHGRRHGASRGPLARDDQRRAHGRGAEAPHRCTRGVRGGDRGGRRDAPAQRRR